MHDFKKSIYAGISWIECDRCGATKHSGFFWLHGWKSKTEPPCGSDIDEWKSKVKPASIKDYEA
jgi:hypothetical protein